MKKKLLFSLTALIALAGLAFAVTVPAQLTEQTAAQLATAYADLADKANTAKTEAVMTAEDYAAVKSLYAVLYSINPTDYPAASNPDKSTIRDKFIDELKKVGTTRKTDYVSGKKYGALMNELTVKDGTSGTIFAAAAQKAQETYNAGIDWEAGVKSTITTAQMISLANIIKDYSELSTIYYNNTSKVKAKNNYTSAWTTAKNCAKSAIDALVLDTHETQGEFDAIVTKTVIKDYAAIYNNINGWQTAYNTINGLNCSDVTVSYTGLNDYVQYANVAQDYAKANSFVKKVKTAETTPNQSNWDAAETEYTNIKGTTYKSITSAKNNSTVKASKVKLDNAMAELNEGKYATAFSSAYEALLVKIKPGYSALKLGANGVIKEGTNDDYAQLKVVSEMWTALKGNVLTVGMTHAQIDAAQNTTQSAKNLAKGYDLETIYNLIAIYDKMHAAYDYLKGLKHSNHKADPDSKVQKYLTKTTGSHDEYKEIYDINKKVAAKTEAEGKVYIDQVFAENLAKLVKSAKEQYKLYYWNALATILTQDYLKEYEKVLVLDAKTNKYVVTAEENDLDSIQLALNAAKAFYTKVDKVESTSLKGKGYSFDTALRYRDWTFDSGLGEIEDSTLYLVGQKIQTYLSTDNGTYHNAMAALKTMKKNALMDQLANNLVNKYEEVYKTEIELTKAGVENEKLVQASNKPNLEKANKDLNNIGAVKAENVNSKELLALGAIYAVWNEATETFTLLSEAEAEKNLAQQVFWNGTTEGQTIRNSAKAKVAAKNYDIANKLKAATWMATWVAYGSTDPKWNILDYQTAVPTGTDKDNLIKAYDEYAALGDAKAYVKEPNYFAALIDIVPAAVTRVFFYDGKGQPRGLNLAYQEGAAYTKDHTGGLAVPTSMKAITEELATYGENAIAVLWGTEVNHDKFYGELPANVTFTNQHNATDLWADLVNFNCISDYNVLSQIHAKKLVVKREGYNNNKEWVKKPYNDQKKAGLYLPFDIEDVKNDTVVNGNDTTITKHAKNFAAITNKLNVYSLGGAYVDDDKAQVSIGLVEKGGNYDNNKLYAYKPYFVVAKDGEVDNLTFEDVTMKVTPADPKTEKVTVAVAGNKIEFNFWGTTKSTSVKANDYFFNAGRFARLKEGKSQTLTAGYVQAECKTNKNVEYTLKFEGDEDEEATAIESVVEENNVNNAIYNVNGMKLNSMSKPGLYIVNGKKVIKK